jgi:hypothetical protein
VAAAADGGASGCGPAALLLARTDDTVVGLTDVGGYPNGFVFLLRVRWGPVIDPYEEVRWPFPDWGSPDPLAGDLFPEELLRFGVQFADGRSVNNLDPPAVGADGPDPNRPMLSMGPGTGGGVDGWSFDTDYRARPLPPPGPLAFICAWPGRGIPTSRVEVDGAAIREAANAAITLCPTIRTAPTTDALRQSEGSIEKGTGTEFGDR